MSACRSTWDDRSTEWDRERLRLTQRIGQLVMENSQLSMFSCCFSLRRSARKYLLPEGTRVGFQMLLCALRRGVQLPTDHQCPRFDYARYTDALFEAVATICCRAPHCLQLPSALKLSPYTVCCMECHSSGHFGAP